MRKFGVETRANVRKFAAFCKNLQKNVEKSHIGDTGTTYRRHTGDQTTTNYDTLTTLSEHNRDNSGTLTEGYQKSKSKITD
jgi:hypothetical protein